MLNWVQPDLILTRSLMGLNRFFRAELDYAFGRMSRLIDFRSASKSDVILEDEISFDVEITPRSPSLPRTGFEV
jgi:hypothetical protein